MTEELSLVPPERLGVLLTEHRTERGLTIEELSERTSLGFTPDELRHIEQGRLALTDSQINHLLTAYDAGAGPLLPDRTDLVIDLGGGAMSAGRRMRALPENPGLDDILGRYLSLLYLMRGLEPGRELPLRGDDLDVLSSALERSITEIEGRLVELMLPGQVTPWFRRLRHRLAVPAAGIVVGLTTVGSLVFVQFPKGQRASEVQGADDAAAVAPDVGLAGSTLVGADGMTPLPGTELSATTAGDADVGTAVAVVREADGEPAVTYEPGTPAAIGEAAEALITYPFRTHLTDWTISYEGPRDGYRGNTNTVTRTITVYVGPTDTPFDVAGVLAHEIGHAFDVLYLDDDIRRQWIDLRGIAEDDWWPESGGNDFAIGAGDFAEAVAVIIAASPSDAVRGSFTTAELDFVRALLP